MITLTLTNEQAQGIAYHLQQVSQYYWSLLDLAKDCVAKADYMALHSEAAELAMLVNEQRQVKPPLSTAFGAYPLESIAGIKVGAGPELGVVFPHDAYYALAAGGINEGRTKIINAMMGLAAAIKWAGYPLKDERPWPQHQALQPGTIPVITRGP